MTPDTLSFVVQELAQRMRTETNADRHALLHELAEFFFATAEQVREGRAYHDRCTLDAMSRTLEHAKQGLA